MHISSSALAHLSGLPRGAGRTLGVEADNASGRCAGRITPQRRQPNHRLLDLEHAPLRLESSHWAEAERSHDQRQWPSLRCARLPRTRSTRRRVIREPRHLQLKVSGPPSRETCTGTDCLNSRRHRYMPSGLAGKVVYQNCGTTSRYLGTVHVQPSFCPSSRLATKATTLAGRALAPVSNSASNGYYGFAVAIARLVSYPRTAGRGMSRSYNGTSSPGQGIEIFFSFDQEVIKVVAATPQTRPAFFPATPRARAQRRPHVVSTASGWTVSRSRRRATGARRDTKKKKKANNAVP